MKTTTRQDDAAHLRTLDYDVLHTAAVQAGNLLARERNHFERQRLKEELAALDAETIRRRKKRA